MRLLSGDRETRLVYLAIVIFMVFVAVLGLSRQALSYYFENDFVMSYIPEAQRFLDGDPLELDYHPPLYSIVLALSYLVTGNWMSAGMIVSLFSSFLLFIAAYKFMGIVFGRWEALGGVAALMLSWTVIGFSQFAANDMFFTTLFFGGMCFLALAYINDKSIYWLLGGAVFGMAVITRMNGLVFMAVLIFALTYQGAKLTRRKVLLLIGTGIVIPVLCWSALALSTGSPIYPRSSYMNLAITYFPEDGDRSSVDAIVNAQQNFTSFSDVIKKDPAHLVVQYTQDLLTNIRLLFTRTRLMPFPFILFVFPGLLLLFSKDLDGFKVVFLLLLFLMILILGMHNWQDRYYIFAVPIYGAAVALLFKVLSQHLQRLKKPAIVAGLIFAFVYVAYAARSEYAYYFKKTVAADALKAAQISELTENSIIVAVHPQLTYYLGSQWHLLPEVESILDLRASLSEDMSGFSALQDVYLFYGFMEIKLRPELSGLLSEKFECSWMIKIGEGHENQSWVLYKVDTLGLKAEHDHRRLSEVDQNSLMGD